MQLRTCLAEFTRQLPGSCLCRTFGCAKTAETCHVLACTYSCNEKAVNDLLQFMTQAFVKARGDGLGFELGQAEFRLQPPETGLQYATVTVAGQVLTR